MPISMRSVYVITGLLVLVVLVSTGAYFGVFGSLLHLSAAEQTLLFTVINLIATVIFALVATINMLESKKVRGEMVRPHLALEPAFFEYDMKTGDIVGFTCLNLLNGGTVARDVEIDFCCSGKCTALYAASVGTNDRVQIWNGRFSELGSNVTTKVRYKNMFDKSLEEVFTINIDSIRKANRKFVPVLNSANAK
jgi:hypothetical protein